MGPQKNFNTKMKIFPVQRTQYLKICFYNSLLSLFLFLSGSQLEEESLSYNLLAELQVRQRYKKQKEQQNIYSHSVLMDIPSKPLPPIQEQCVLQPISNKGQLVASFPSIISHKNFMNEALITGPYLTFTFTLKNYSLNTVKRP